MDLFVFSASNILMTKVLNIFYHVKLIYRFTKNYQLEQEYVWNGLLKIADEVYDIKQEKSKAVNNVDDDDGNCYGYTKKYKNFITTLMAPENGLSEEEIKDEINTLIAAVSGDQLVYF